MNSENPPPEQAKQARIFYYVEIGIYLLTAFVFTCFWLIWITPDAKPEDAKYVQDILAYVLKELRIYFGIVEDEDAKSDINVLERAFRSSRLTGAVKKELNQLRRNNVTGASLLKSLARLYQQHNLRDWIDRPQDSSDTPVPKVVCSEALV